MSFLSELLNPPVPNSSKQSQYLFDNSVHDALLALQYVMNPSVITNADFSAGGVTITQADGDNAEFFTGWKVVGASVATYTLSPVNYPTASLIQSASPTFSKVVVSGYAGAGLYFYQRQPNTVRKYQKNYLTYGFIINNNQSKTIQVEAQIFSFYDPLSSRKRKAVIFLKPGLNRVTSTILTDSLNSVSVGASPYTEFRLAFTDLEDGTADLDVYQIKCEFGTASTLLNQES